MPRGGRRPGQGRPKGVLNKKSQAIAREAAERGITPLEVMLEAMQFYHAQGDRDKAAAIAKDAAPYIHPRLAAIEHRAKDDGGERNFTITIGHAQPKIIDVAPNGHLDS
jgi:hypothetical protein